MKVKFEAVIDGISKYMDKEIYVNMNSWQEVIARAAVGLFIENRAATKEAFINNGIIRSFGIINESGDVEIDRLASSLKREIQRKKEISFKVPMYGEFKFNPSDVDTLYEMITGTNLINEITEVKANENNK